MVQRKTRYYIAILHASKIGVNMVIDCELIWSVRYVTSITLNLMGCAFRVPGKKQRTKKI